MRVLLPTLLLASLAACATAPNPAPGVPGKVAILTDPPGATITFVDGSTCQTPCEVTVPMEMVIIVGKAGYKAIRADLAPTDGPERTYTLQPVGRSEPVDVFEIDEGPEG